MSGSANVTATYLVLKLAVSSAEPTALLKHEDSVARLCKETINDYRNDQDGAHAVYGVLCLTVRDSHRLHDAHSLSIVDLFGIISPITIFLSGRFICQ